MNREVEILKDIKVVTELLIKYNTEDINEQLRCILDKLYSKYYIMSNGKESW